jgi:uncharacterized membrane protein
MKRKTTRTATTNRTETRRSHATAPFGVLLVTPAALNSLLTGGALTALAPAPTTTRSAAKDVATFTPRKATATINRGNAGRGRVAGIYVPKAGVKLGKDVNPKIVKVFGFIQKNRKGITQKALVKTSKLPNSTVWYALKRLQKDKAVAYQPTSAAA